MTDRMKASDVYRETNFAFGQKVPFAEAFPSIESFRIEVKESKDMIWGGDEHIAVFTENRMPGEYFDCHNPRCYNGGVSVGTVLRDMTREGKTHHEVSQKCSGYEGAPKGRKRYKSCYHFFKVSADIKYKEGGGAEPNAQTADPTSGKPVA